MKNRKYSFSYLILLICIVFSSSDVMAAGMGNTGSPCGGIFPPCPIPLNSGEIFLLIAGSALGIYKIYCSIKKNPA
jgi:hypothetical protein